MQIDEPKRRRWLAWGWRLVRLPLIAIVGLALMLTTLQDKMLHYPERLEAGEALRQASGLRLTPWPVSEETRGWLREPPSAPVGTLVLFHGNGGHALHRAWLADVLVERGYRVVLAEYPGYGHRSGTALDEASLVKDAVETIRRLRAAYPGRLIVAGESLGAGVAAATLAQVGKEVDAVLLITPWNRLAEAAAQHYPWLPVGMLLRDRYDSVANLRGFVGPKMVIVAGDDQVIPAPLGLDLYQQLPEPRRLLTLPGTGHNDWMDAMTPAHWRQTLDFLNGSASGRP